jgi:hypothetical protein
MRARNNRTNFVDPGAFEKQIETAAFGQIPVKQSFDANTGAQLSVEIRASHINVGTGHKDNFAYQSNRVYGS